VNEIIQKSPVVSKSSKQESSSFLKKRTKKLFSIGFVPQTPAAQR
jgi:hypothetical protein